MTLSHFTAAVIFAFFVSIVFGITQKNTPKEMRNYAVYCFVFFVVGTIIAAWFMAALRHFGH